VKLFLVFYVFNIMLSCCVLPCNAVALVSDRQLNRNLSMPVFKVWDTTHQLKKLVVAATLSEVIDKGLSLGMLVLVLHYRYVSYPLCPAGLGWLSYQLVNS